MRICRLRWPTSPRLDCGPETPALVVAAARVAAIDAERRSTETSRDVGIARERLAALLGIRVDDAALSETAAVVAPPVQALIDDALAARPDLRAAEIAVEAAARQLGLAQSEIWRISAVLDANGSGSEGFETGPGIDLGLPIFNRNQGGISRADAAMERAARGSLQRSRALLERAVGRNLSPPGGG